MACAKDPASSGLGPENILVVYNRDSVDSAAIARYYRKLRGLSADQLCPVSVNRYALSVPLEDYRDLRKAIIAHIGAKKLQNRVRCLLLMPDIPQGVRTSNPGRAEYLALDSMLADIVTDGNPPTKPNRYPVLCRLGGNFVPKGYSSKMQDACGGMMLVSRIEAPGLLAMKRVLDSAQQGEALARAGTPFAGTFYIDTSPGKPGLWTAFNASMQACAEMGKAMGNRVVIDNTDKRLTTFNAGPAVFYCGWYTLSSKINRGQDRWAPGAIAVEIHSGSARLLRSSMKPNPYANSYVAFFAAHGVAGTYGAFREPYLAAFPKPHEVLTSLRAGLTWAECFWANVPHLNWQMVLLGDPLYRPFPEGTP